MADFRQVPVNRECPNCGRKFLTLHHSVCSRCAIEEYKESQKNRVSSGEELFEMRAAFGEGTEVVNIITGKRFKV